MNPGTGKTINLIIKVAILLLASIFIYNKLNNNPNLENFYIMLNKLSSQRVYLILGLVFLLMFVNWGLESLKWQFVLKSIEPISIRQAIQSVFCGLTLAVFTPNRIGEYGGRIFFLPPRKRIIGTIAMAVGAIGQMVITNILGALAALWFLYTYIHLNVWVYCGICAIGILFCLFFLMLYFNINYLLKRLSSIIMLKRFEKVLKILSRYSSSQLSTVFIYSFLRYLVFTSQYCFIITLVIPEIQILHMVMMISIVLFIQSALPSLDLLDVGVRAMTATYFFSYITNNDAAIMASIASIWLINLIIPAILGSVFVYKLNFFGTNHN